jgi:hypothetical protein
MMRLKIVLFLLLLISCKPQESTTDLGKPDDFAATVGSSTSIGLTWLKVNDAKTYEIERQVGDGNFLPLITIAHEVGGPFGQSHTDTDLTPGNFYTYRIRAKNDQTQSDWSVSAKVQTPVEASTKYRITGYWLGAGIPNIYISTDTGVNFSGATAAVNETTLTYVNPPGAYRATAIPDAAAGTLLSLNITVPEGTITAEDVIPGTPSITSPVSSADVTENQPLEVNWTYTGTDPDRFYLQLLGNGPNYVVSDLPGTARTLTIPAEEVIMPSSGSTYIFLYAVNDGKDSFTGPFLPTSEMGIAASTNVQFDIVP